MAEQHFLAGVLVRKKGQLVRLASRLHINNQFVSPYLVFDLVSAARIWSLVWQEDTLLSKDICHTLLYGKWFPKKSLSQMSDSGLSRICAIRAIFVSLV